MMYVMYVMLRHEMLRHELFIAAKFLRVYKASSKHEEGWENLRQLYIVEGLNNFRVFTQPPSI